VPHAIVLGSRIAVTDRLAHPGFDEDSKSPSNDSTATLHQDSTSIQLKGNRSLDFIRNHIKRASIDVALSLSKALVKEQGHSDLVPVSVALVIK
jgi:hypothetical protein